MLLNIAICDDEDSSRKIMIEYIERILDIENYRISEYKSGEELLSNFPEVIDILLLDVQMGGLTGMQAAKEIRRFDTSVNIIFTTAFVDFMQEGYEVRAFRYLLKPIAYEDFKKHLLGCINSILESEKRHLAIKEIENGNIVRIPIDSILYVETESRYVLIHTDKKTYKSRMGISNIERELECTKFYRCHRCYLINLKKVEGMKQNSVLIKGEDIIVSRYKMKELRIQLTSILGEILC
ncbi:LytR/AlgR family response regulator transcription factor [Asaccharospora irregularis]|uniref:Stage 0 sporulation protein A homolog n=1 Tax=Asaccharospora irregularis DSM 2635 TaxID=1121321 RepID=A0A1M5R549_9FIRM|nr:LytTR family DNA-binding domain-containing protein [Asaccharospora irregularis]SHH21505.1 DNA-binding response regulator, LytR/AlgR family [Asaccharospora irregularis DSM 2635]